MMSPLPRRVQCPMGRWSAALFGLLLILTGCASKEPEPEPAPVAQRAPDYSHGARLYQLYCSACHDAGQKDAPTLDDIEAWDERAFQWEPVLRQHAAQGFLDMPPQGDHPDLSQQSMNDVLFFMFTKIRALDE